MSELLEKAKAERPHGRGARRARWTKYREVFEVLTVVKGYPNLSAVSWIAEESELTDEEARQLYEASRKWTLRTAEELCK